MSLGFCAVCAGLHGFSLQQPGPVSYSLVPLLSAAPTAIRSLASPGERGSFCTSPSQRPGLSLVLCHLLIQNHDDCDCRVCSNEVGRDQRPGGAGVSDFVPVLFPSPFTLKPGTDLKGTLISPRESLSGCFQRIVTLITEDDQVSE